jgi:hypothetical protein
MAFAFQKQRLRGKEPLGKKKKIETLRQKKKNSPPVYNKIGPVLQGPRLAAGATGRQAGQKPPGKISGLAETVSCT